MIYFVTGAQREKVQRQAHTLVEALQKKRPGALVFRMSPEEWNRESFDGIAGGQGLFEHKYIVVLDSLFTNEEAAEYFSDTARLKELAAGDHAFIFSETAPKAATRKVLEKAAEKTWDTDANTAGQDKTAKAEFNIFALTDALGARDRARLWTLYQKALLNGSEPEEIHGILFWQVKTLLGVAQSKTPEEAGVKPFVWGKARGFLKNFSAAELKKISAEMVGLYHNSRLESLALEDSLELFVLKV